MKGNYDENTVNSLLCLWEAVLDLRSMKEPNKASELLENFIACWGTATVRDLIVSSSLIDQIEKHWPAYEEKVGDPFDWEYVPAFLNEYIIRTNLSYTFDCSDEQGEAIIEQILCPST